jgi:hypothetical protein
MNWSLAHLRLVRFNATAMLGYEFRLQYAPYGIQILIFMVCLEMPQSLVTEA